MGDVMAVLADALFSGKALRLDGRLLERKFASIGPLPGKTSEEIVAIVGPPLSIQPMRDGTLFRWQRPGYWISVRFDSQGTCLGITHVTLA